MHTIGIDFDEKVVEIGEKRVRLQVGLPSLVPRVDTEKSNGDCRKVGIRLPFDTASFARGRIHTTYYLSMFIHAEKKVLVA